ncbi:MAG: teichuronic acid exporter [Crocinitomicaceae bacterium]|jgi:teichuronic acid exporter
MIKKINFKSKLLRSIVVLMTGTLASQIINLALSIPSLKYYYEAEDMAEWGLFMRIVAVGGALATARYEFAIPVAKADIHSFRLYRIALRIAIKVSLITGVAALIPIFFFSDLDDMIFYALIPIALFFTAYYSIGTNWAIRKKRYRGISFSKITATSVGGGSKLLFGWAGTGYIGLIIGTVIGMIASNTWFFRDFLKLNRNYKVKSNSPRNKMLAKEYSEFPKVNLPHTLMDVGRDLLVAILLIKIFSEEDFGYFDQSYRMLRLPLMLAGLAVGQVFFQRSAEKYSNRENILPMILKSVKLLTLISIVPFTLIFFFGDDLFAYVFGERWRGAGEYSEIMAPWFMLNFIASPISFLPLVLRKQRQFFLMAAVGSIMMILAVIIPTLVFEADVKVTLWALSLSQVAYFIFFIFKILDFIRKSNKERSIEN